MMLLAQIVRIPAGGVRDFQEFESRVLPLLPRHGGALVRRVRGHDGQFDVAPRRRAAVYAGVEQPIVGIRERQHAGVGAAALNRQIAGSGV